MMVELHFRKMGILKITVNWFGSKPCTWDWLRGKLYRQSHCLQRAPGYIRQPFYTMLIDLRRDMDEIFQDFHKSTKYQVQRAEREGVLFSIVEDPESFTEFYNAFARSKGLPALKHNWQEEYNGHLIITQAVYEDIPLVMHCYLVDWEAKRCRCLYLASLFRYENDSAKRNLIGRANRFLHYCDMKYFREAGLFTYDFGGYAKGTTDLELEGINRFKESFGGRVFEESHYIPVYMFLFQRIRQLWQRNKLRIY